MLVYGKQYSANEELWLWYVCVCVCVCVLKSFQNLTEQKFEEWI